MLVIPAIDLLDGKCVRLHQGKYDRATEYSEDPVAMAKHWQDTGAEWLHIVDLNGAREGQPRHREVMAAIRKATPSAWLQVSGGLRTVEAVEQALEVADRVVLGTVAVKQPELVQEAVSRFAERVAVGSDARDGLVATDGWESSTTRTAADVAREMAAGGVQTLIFTDIDADGTLRGPNLSALTQLRTIPHVRLIAAGGVGSIAHLRQIAKLGVDATIVGKALYEGAIDLGRAMHDVEDTPRERYEW